jgi:Spx/MgsR family transcriptional regulator
MERRASVHHCSPAAPFGACVTTIYGIKNCDTMKKARTWLDEHQVAHEFHDYKAAAIDRAHLERWCRELGWERVLNRSGTTFRKLPEAQRDSVNEKRAIELMLAQPSMIKRPILEHGDKLVAGFKPAEYTELFSK